MVKRIKLENIIEKGYDRQTGRLLAEVTNEYVCESCRHLVGAEDAFCWQCGSKLEESNLVEHYHKGERLTDEEFRRRRPA